MKNMYESWYCYHYMNLNAYSQWKLPTVILCRSWTSKTKEFLLSIVPTKCIEPVSFILCAGFAFILIPSHHRFKVILSNF